MAMGWRKEYLRYQSYFLNIRNAYKKRPDIRMFLDILLSLITISFFSAFALRPTILTVGELFKEIRTKEKMVAEMDTKIANLQAAQSILNSENGLSDLLDAAVPLTAQPEDLAHQIGGLANQNAVEILNFSVEETVLKGKPPVTTSSKTFSALVGGSPGMGFSFGVRGDYQNLFSTLSGLENLLTPVRIDGFGLNLIKAEEGNFLNLTVSGRVPFLGTQ